MSQDFMEFKTAVQKQFAFMCRKPTDLFTTNVSKDDMWDMYLESFPKGTNPIYRERTEHDCQCCRQFIRNYGNVVALINNEMVSIWDITVGGEYQVVADALVKEVTSYPIKNVFMSSERDLGTDHNHEMNDKDVVQRWEHFYLDLPEKFDLVSEYDQGSALSKTRTTCEVWERAMKEITMEACDIVLDLIGSKSIYRGEEFKKGIQTLRKHQKKYHAIDGDKHRNNYCWTTSTIIGGACRIRNSAIGTLLNDISDGVDLNTAVKKFGNVMNPGNYKHPKTLFTKKMVEKAQARIADMGFEDSLERRLAVMDDITINNVIFANRDTKKALSVFDELKGDIKVNPKEFDRVEEINIEDFIKDVVPTADKLELLFEGNHIGNMVSLIVPKIKGSKSMFKWGNGASWVYTGGITDSIAQNVKNAGGNIKGVLRYSIQWNDGDNNQNDFDAHCIEPNGNLISFPKKGEVQPSSGMLDVDIVSPGNKVAVENIVWTDKSKMENGKYKFIVHNYCHNGGRTGFTAEIEYEGTSYQFAYDRELRQSEKVLVAELTFSKSKGIKFLKKGLTSAQISKEAWGINTLNFQNVSMLMHSPNHWDDEGIGNKHYFFMLEGCNNPEASRGFFNEFLTNELMEEKKVFQALGSKMLAQPVEGSLSGLGFSSTKRDSVLCKVHGSFSRTVKIKF